MPSHGILHAGFSAAAFNSISSFKNMQEILRLYIYMYMHSVYPYIKYNKNLNLTDFLTHFLTNTKIKYQT